MQLVCPDSWQNFLLFQAQLLSSAVFLHKTSLFSKQSRNRSISVTIQRYQEFTNHSNYVIITITVFILAIEKHFVSLVALSADRYLPTPFGPYRLRWFWFSFVRFMHPKSDPARVALRNSCFLRRRSHSTLTKSFITVAVALPWFWIIFLWKLDADTEIFRYLFRSGKEERNYIRLLTHSWSWTHQPSKRYGIEFCVKDDVTFQDKAIHEKNEVEVQVQELGVNRNRRRFEDSQVSVFSFKKKEVNLASLPGCICAYGTSEVWFGLPSYGT